MSQIQNPDIKCWYEFIEQAAESNGWSDERQTDFATLLCIAITRKQLPARNIDGFPIDPPELPFPVDTVFLDQQEAVQWMRTVGPFNWGLKKNFASRGTLQDELVLTTIRDLGYDPLSIPEAVKGKKGVKAQIRENARKHKEVFSSDGQFDRAWERLSGKGIKYKKGV